jgi:hypothetical protein
VDQSNDISPRKAREIWCDHQSQQVFEHELINRKTTWLLTTQSILFVAYAASFQGADPEGSGPDRSELRMVVAGLGLGIAFIVLIGVVGLIRSKYLSWQKYEEAFEPFGPARLPGPLAHKRLQWGVDTRTTFVTLAPDVALPAAFILAWLALLVMGASRS